MLHRSMSLDKWIMSFTPHYSVTQNSSTVLKIPVSMYSSLLSSTQSLGTIDCFIVSVVVPFPNVMQLESYGI